MKADPMVPRPSDMIGDTVTEQPAYTRAEYAAAVVNAGASGYANGRKAARAEFARRSLLSIAWERLRGFLR